MSQDSYSIIELTRESLLNDFALRSFRDMADEDYVTARMAYRAGLSYPSLWQSHQTIEKYLKCILLLHRIPAKEVYHGLGAALNEIGRSSKLSLNLISDSLDFIHYIDEVGEFRYFEVSTEANGKNLLRLDRLVWELRRFCTLDRGPRQLILKQGEIPPRYQLSGGILEEIARSKENWAHEALMWSNGFIGRRLRRKVRIGRWSKTRYAPLSMHPEILEDVLKYVFLPRRLVKAWQGHKSPGYEVPPDSDPE